MNDGVRLRVHSSKEISDEVFYSKKRQSRTFETLNETHHLLYLLLCLLAVSLTVIVLEKKLPEPLLTDTEGLYPEKFVAERARNNLVKLTKIGPRITGSYENEVMAVNFLKTEIQNIVKDAHNSHEIQIDITKHSGAFPLTFLDGMTNVYRNVQNVIVKVGSRINSKHSLLVNCHFDTFPESPGGSDDGAGCAVMLEMLRIIAQSPKILKHNIIFLFNGAEENLMQASHGFITQHKWASEVKSFINLEACGAGGRELLFQAGPDNPWILEVYSESVPYPYASSLAQEIFQSGVIPGDTDFRIFRDFGKVSGLDFAWSTNGYVYHTRFDNVDQVPLGSLQRTGDNILALVRGITAGHYLSDIVMNHQKGSLVFFDFLGAFVVRWPEYLASTINIAVILTGLYSIFLNMETARKLDLRHSVYIKQLALSVSAVIGSYIFSMISVTIVAVFLTHLGKVMSWYARPAWLFFLYICPTIFSSMAFFLAVSNHQKKENITPWTLYYLYFDAYNLLWITVLSTCVILRLRSGFIPLHWVIFPSIGNIIREKFFKRWRDGKWLLYHMGVISLPYIQSFYLTLGALYLFIPIMGRSGAGINAEIVIANMISFIFCLLLSFTLPIVIVVKNAGRLISIMIGIFLIAVSILILTPLGFPYSGDPLAPAPARFMIAHTHRQYFNENGTVRHSGTGYWLVDLDMNSPHNVETIVPEVATAGSTLRDCKEELYCGLPYLMPVTTFLWKTSWIPGPAPLIKIPTRLERISKITKGNIISFRFNVTGPDHIGIILSPYEGVRLIKWSVLDDPPLEGPLWNNRHTYFIYYACAADCDPYSFSVDLEIPHGHKGPSLSIALAGHFLHGENQKSLRFKTFLSQFPSWTAVIPWTATYTSWIY
ncbi:endoplasmic reticulum metallopeptidase 1-like isoform X1 [Neodiprion virginianus]|uniref:endoplasmic reticulum metallopeptidase 1-like isoform X1 n=1 Tax=Neodiprion virginianus TaxID=2961670 RepID=UPI001EE69ED9|nr:endoplasmic reticulum metallopeptidase 1-like isoform X1 [Neodiprion virginianus]XP_046630570.1 endoplasmic reticulum metallopeptidase 1-like isoform X1 [Neodiprion virginianus]XP_046630571.1 endoplasmic reticulum metallopeptidase 1-like isoform X1 [Neodiprion virginianus]XP_046630572.1 endoplasmic reticulum metallopeptidase 1-like isoform X1 [Neodiprion virginianus]XP_046630573.1 endoplasmic reticulum metallopeptidase 1-like isoform X1 [Neodiprion virginianus]XP_046630574.1 endoplasmic ret